MTQDERRTQRKIRGSVRESIRGSARPRRSTIDPAAIAAEFLEPEEPEEPELDEFAEPVDWSSSEPEWPPQPPPPGPPLKERLRRTPPGVAILTVAAVVSLGALLLAIAARTASVQLLTSLGLACGMVYVAVAFACAAATWRLGHEGQMGPALLVAFIGGSAAFVAAGAFAGALVLFLALGF